MKQNLNKQKPKSQTEKAAKSICQRRAYDTDVARQTMQLRPIQSGIERITHRVGE